MKRTYDIQVDPAIFNPVYLPHLNNLSRTQIFYGGSGSGKSVFLAQRCIWDMLQGGRNYLICRQVGRTVRKSVFNEVYKVITDWGVISLFDVNKTDGVITCHNGYQILFVGLDDPEKIKSITPAKGVITDVWVEESTEAERATIKQLYKRQRGGSDKTAKRLMMSFNPILQSHWIYEDYFNPVAWMDDQTEHKTDELSILKTWYIHNRFLTPDDVRDLENEKDPYYHNVYTLGNWGVLGNVIFTNWRVEDLSGMEPQFANRRHGLDFGFSSDPAAVVQTHYDRMRKTIYIYDELYETGLTNDLLAADVVQRIAQDDIKCDSAEPKSIAELRRYGVNARPAVKGKDSVLHGIQWLQQQTIVIDRRCVNTRNELQQYKWEEDKDGRAIRRPVDRNNHIIDALRYAYEDEARGGARKAVSRQG
jgi:phage terminase large subunit